MPPSEAEKIAWAAGLFEGEGSLGITRRPGKRTPELVYGRLTMGMADRDVVERFAAVVGCGKIGSQQVPEGHKPIHLWACGSTKDVRRVLLMFLPWLGERRLQRAREILGVLSDADRRRWKNDG